MKVQSETAKEPRRPFQITSGKYQFQRAVDCVLRAGKPLSTWKLAEALGVYPSEAEKMALCAVRAALLFECSPRVFAATNTASQKEGRK